MGGIRVSLRDDEVADVVEAIGTHFSDRLTDWEIGFMESIRSRIDNNRGLTDGQRAKLDQIFERVSHRGQG